MKIKNTTFIQRHAEKIALGSAGLFFLLVALYYLLGIPSKPFGITLGAAKQSAKMNISDAQDVVKQKAEELDKKLRKNASPVDPAEYRPSNDPNDIRSLSYPDLLRKLRTVPVAAGSKLLNVADADELRDDRPYLLMSALACLLVGLSLLALAASGPNGVVAPVGALAILGLATLVIVVLWIQLQRRSDEFRRMSDRKHRKSASVWSSLHSAPGQRLPTWPTRRCLRRSRF